MWYTVDNREQDVVLDVKEGEEYVLQKGDICYILTKNNKVEKVKVMSGYEDSYIIQSIGKCGATKVSENRLFRTKEAAESSRKTSYSFVQVQLSGDVD